MLARQLGMMPVTLQQRRCGDGQSFASTKDEMRSALAQPLLHEIAASVADIAWKPGFTEPITLDESYARHSTASLSFAKHH